MSKQKAPEAKKPEEKKTPEAPKPETSKTKQKIKHCWPSCKNEFQDESYGKGMRVHNRRDKGKTGEEWHCTVCGRLS